ncbi:hypothetical protein FJY71_09095 [candidate division WOR-3 bacterium]|nr:hypothetical protein [candidate division WOR-3 bacterium]
MIDTTMGRIGGTLLGLGLIVTAVVLYSNQRPDVPRRRSPALDAKQNSRVYKQRIRQTQRLLETDGTYLDLGWR